MKPTFRSKRANVILVQDRVSHTSKHLRKPLRCRRVTPYSTGVRPVVPGSTVINFGSRQLPIQILPDTKVLNPVQAVQVCADKLKTFRALQTAGVPTVQWTVDRAEAEKWHGKGRTVLCRTQLASSGGRGIVVSCGERGLVDAPLWTRYFPKTHEFRVHVVNGEAIDIVEKKLRNDLKESREDKSIIRNHSNGWVFAHDNLTCSHEDDRRHMEQVAVGAVRALNLDFGAADLLAIMGEPDGNGVRRLGKLVVCEVNSAPGLENTATMNAYVTAFNKMIGGV